MRSKSFRILLNIAVILSMLLPNITAATTAYAQLPEPGPAAQPRPMPESGLFRTHITVDAPARWQRLDALGVVILQRQEDSAVVLADDAQLEALARLRFQPRASDELGDVMSNCEKAHVLILKMALQDGGFVRKIQ